MVFGGASVIFDRIRDHDFHPIKDGFTYDRNLDTQGVADLRDRDWKVRTFAVRDLVQLGNSIEGDLIAALNDRNSHIRHIATKVLGILHSETAVSDLEKTLLEDDDEVVRAQAAVSIWQIGKKRSLGALRKAKTSDESKDVMHQAELAIHAIRKGYTATPELKKAYENISEQTFNEVEEGKKAPDFTLPDTDENEWRLSDKIGEKPIVLIWIFADWCPVCHNEFSELIEMREELEPEIQFATLECHDLYPARVMVGKEFEPKYWFSDKPFYKKYVKKIWWPHLADRAALVGMRYGVQPMAYTVHAEWINRPAVVIIDEEGMVRVTYYGTFWGDRPSIKDIQQMIQNRTYNFVSPEKLE
ncbi:MAG: HEAT repeat domain-containing protein [Balneolaceae bacterium]